MQISIQRDNYKVTKHFATDKSYILWKNSILEDAKMTEHD